MPMDRLTDASLGARPASAAAACRAGQVSARAGRITDMNAILLFAGLVLGLCLGGAIGYLLARGRQADAAADMTGRAQAADERARAAQERAALLERAAQEKAALLDSQLAERFQALSA